MADNAAKMRLHYGQMVQIYIKHLPQIEETLRQLHSNRVFKILLIDRGRHGRDKSDGTSGTRWSNA